VADCANAPRAMLIVNRNRIITSVLLTIQFIVWKHKKQRLRVAFMGLQHEKRAQ
jgi:hypothetical protein